eukprot:CAMPEP_0197339498 /NCGR_PEP_ID=MMETSP0892-20130614/43812_1 /TAXON_ID=44058 ORGANISM="Aureoumbra lagunensis, Strain CCMP1510" /NCGR_SAMPLE_ID=MMETSP0892 /ASSEMBLY_ACC=CAM_ASM_000538 /LENGTH=49 /DNA_ID=CAMNT_0042843715 /DNA_START=642 /DNA_END=791 /DNA_ORIENTATION=+
MTIISESDYGFVRMVSVYIENGMIKVVIYPFDKDTSVSKMRKKIEKSSR